MRDIFNITMKPGESVQLCLARLMEIHQKLSNGGYAFTDREMALVMLIGLLQRLFWLTTATHWFTFSDIRMKVNNATDVATQRKEKNMYDEKYVNMMIHGVWVECGKHCKLHIWIC